MAKIEQGILGPFRGTVGTVIGYRWRDRWCMRARPSHYNDRRSEAQLEQRGRFKAMIQFASPATPLLRIGLRAWAAEHGLTEGNAFLRLNHGCFSGISGGSGGSEVSGGIDFAGLRFSLGSLPGLTGGVARRVDALTVSVGWERGLGRGADRVHVYAYCLAAGWGLAVADVARGAKQAQFTLPQEFAGEEVHLWAFAVNAEGVASATCYLGFEDKGLEDKKDKKNKVENPENQERTENLEITGLRTQHAASLQEPAANKPLQLSLDFG